MTDVLLERATSRSVPDGYDNARRVSYKQLPGSGGDLNEIADVWGILGVGLMPYFKTASSFFVPSSSDRDILVFRRRGIT